jgi:hypothetical protein
MTFDSEEEFFTVGKHPTAQLVRLRLPQVQVLPSNGTSPTGSGTRMLQRETIRFGGRPMEAKRFRAVVEKVNYYVFLHAFIGLRQC